MLYIWKEQVSCFTPLPPRKGHLPTVATFVCPKVAAVERFDCVAKSVLLNTNILWY